MDAFAFGQMYIYWLGVKRASRVTYSGRRYPENIYRPPRQENKRSFWEPASYDDLSARFNGVPSVAVTTLDVDPRFRLCTRFPPCSPARVCWSIRMNLWPFPFFPTHRSNSGSEALERYIDFYERVEAVKLLHQKDIRFPRVILVKIVEPRHRKPKKLILGQSRL